MLTSFTVRTTATIREKKYDRWCNDFGCRESWLSVITDAIIKNVNAREMHLPVDTTSECELHLCVPVARISPLCEEIYHTWFEGEITFAFTTAPNPSVFNTKEIDICVVRSKGLLAISYTWWLILAQRLLLDVQGKNSGLRDLMARSSTYDRTTWFCRSLDRDLHMRLLDYFEEVKYPELWAYRGDFYADTNYGPLNYHTAYQEYIKERLYQ